MMDCSTAEPEKRHVKCRKYGLTVFGKDGPVIIQGETCGLWTATGCEAQALMPHLNGSPVQAEKYIDAQFELRWKILGKMHQMVGGCYDI